MIPNDGCDPHGVSTLVHVLLELWDLSVSKLYPESTLGPKGEGFEP